MKICKVFLGLIAGAWFCGMAAAQSPVLGSIEAPYGAVLSSVKIAGKTYGAGAVAYGPVNTPLVVTGTNLGASGTVQFVGYKNGAVDLGYTFQGSVSFWGSNMIFVTVPSGAVSGLVTVTVEGKTSNALPFIVTPGTYSGTCPASAPSTQLQIITSSLHNGTAGQTYSATVGAQGGTTPYTWSLDTSSLPNGLSFDASSGTISGTPTGPAGPVNLTFRVADAASPKQTDETVLSLTIEPQSLAAAPSMYTYSAQYDGAGNITTLADSVNGTWTMTTVDGKSGYDTLNRLAVATQVLPNQTQYLCWNYDEFGNRKQQEISSASFQAGSGGPTACTPQSTATLSTSLASYNAANRITSTNARGVSIAPSYDDAGNMQNDGVNSYLYDAEGRICAVQIPLVSGGTVKYLYLYDAEGQRIAKGTITTFTCNSDPNVSGFKLTESYVMGQGGKELAMFDGNGNWQRSNAFGAGKQLATYDMIPNPSGTSPSLVAALHFQITDPLGNRRLQTNSVAQPETDCQNLPFGDQLNCYPDYYAAASADDATPLHYTGRERDTESGNDYFGARYYGSSMGRFLSPDEPFVDQSPADPQSWNLYAYVRNNPLVNVDENGQDCIYNNGDGTGYVLRGDCKSDSDSGIFVDGTIDVNSFHYNEDNNSSTFTYYKDDGALGLGLLQGPNLTNGFDPGSLGAGAFGPANNSTWKNAAGTVNAAGGLAVGAMAPWAGAIAGCASGDSKGACGVNLALSVLPEVSELRAGGKLVQEMAAAGKKGAEIIEYSGGAVQAAKDFESLQGAERTLGNVKVKELSDGSKAVLRGSKDGRVTLEIQHAGGGVTKFRYN